MRIALSAAALLLAGCSTVPAPEASRGLPLAPQFVGEPLPESVPSDLPRIARPLHYDIAVTPDMAGLAFAGTVGIDLEVYEATGSLVLHANELEIGNARLIPAGGGVPLALSVTPDAESQTARFTAPQTIAPGAYRLEADYTGKIYTQANGLFALDYPDKRTGEEVRGLFTQFEAPDARRFAPMFDEPSYKATFDLSARVPADLMAVGNMPVKSEKDLGDGTKLVTFGTSPKMSSYLLFFALGDFERMAKRAPDGTEVGIVAPAGSGEQARYALDSLAPMMGYFADYFGQPYTLPKLDNVTAPGQSQFFGAMENWGAILTFERILLTDPAITSAATRQSIYSVQAHETAHQWFGNIVTMAWWDDLWLNEGFASWMETKTTNHFNPDWHALLGRVGARESAMNLDSFATTHPVIQEIRTVEELGSAFDAIAYSKGESVISMLEAYAGEDVWRAGLRRYMERHKYGNTTSADLWRAVEEEGAVGLTQIADDFTRQPGIPLVMADAQCRDDNTIVSLRQSEFSRDRKQEAAADPLNWHVPLLVSVGGGEPVRHVLEGTAELTLPGCGALLVNDGQLGYFRTLYEPEMIATLAQAMPRLDPIDQVGLVSDNLALARGGYQPYGLALDLLAATPTGANPVVADSAVDDWGNAYELLEDEEYQAKLAGIAREKWLPRLQQLGFEPIPGEPAADANLRAELITTLGAMGDTTVAEQARERFAALGDDPRAMDGPLKTTWLAIAARNATPEEWEMLRRLAASSASTVEKQTYYQRLGSARDPELAERALVLALSGEAGTASAEIIATTAGEHAEMVFDFVMANRERVNELVDASGQANYVARIGAQSDQPAMIEKLEAFRETLPENERKPIDRALVSLRERFASEPRMRAELRDWLDAR